jgi:ATP-dependent exoDNAse (exonuclease V) alpha subunit
MIPYGLCHQVGGYSVLTIFEVTSATGAKDYYGTADYYSQGQETVGHSGGKLAAELGLSGKVSKDEFERMVDNLHPQTGEQLTARTNKFRRIAYDFTVSQNKSSSIVRAFAPADLAELMDAARDKAIAGMMAAVEADMQCRERRNGADYDITTSNLAYTAFHHTTSRPVEYKEFIKRFAANDNLPDWLRAMNDNIPPDMQEHSHLLVWNATRSPDGRILAGQFGKLKRDGEYYSAIFDALYARELEKLGFVIDRKGGKKWEIAGISQSMIDKFSKRKDQVEDTARRLNITDAAEKGELGKKTRSKKQKELTMPELREAWWAQLNDDECDALARVYAGQVAPGREVTAEQAVSFAIAHLSDKYSAFDERDMKATALLYGLGSVTPEMIDREMQSPRHGLIADEIDGRRVVTTEALQAEERYIVGQAARGLGAACPVGVAEGLTRTLADGRALNDEQWQLTQGLLNTSNRVAMVKGPAGAGKSYSLQKFDEGVRLAGETATYLATTAKAAKELEKEGFEVNTVARFLLDPKLQAAAQNGRAVIDESSMLGHKEAVKLFKLAEQLNLKLIFVGDPMQHGSVPRGALMRVLEEHALIRPFRLTRIMRQQDADYRAAAQLLSEGKTLEGFEALDRKGWVKEITDPAERNRAMAEEYVKALSDKESVLLVSPTHAEARAITREIRSLLRETGTLGKDEREFTRLVQVDTSEPERREATTYEPGDVIQFYQNAKGGFVKGERLTVSDPAEAPLEHADKFALYRPESVLLAAGDRIRFTAPVQDKKRDHKYKNGDTLTVAGFTRRGDIRLDDGRVIDADAGHFRPAFVETSFGAQGQTVKRVILGMSEASLGATNQEQMYVSATRANRMLSLYTDDKDALKVGIQRSSQKAAALDVQPEQKRRDLHKEHLERQRRLGYWRRKPAATPAPVPMPLPKPESQVTHGRR